MNEEGENSEGLNDRTQKEGEGGELGGGRACMGNAIGRLW